MTSLENNVGFKNVEQIRNPELEHEFEDEHKLTPVHPELLTWLYKEGARPVEQLYLSTPHDSSSLRLRALYGENGPEYSATRKGQGIIKDGALSRPQTEISIAPEIFAHYQSADFPRVQKLRADVMDGVTVDFYDDPVTPVVVEVEHSDPHERARLIEMMQDVSGGLIDRSDDPSLTTEAIAYRMANKEHLAPPESLEAFTHRVLGEMIALHVTGKKQVVVGITGMSGSGTSTVARKLQDKTVELFGEFFKPAVVSTDDYHYGKKRLEERHGTPYTDWDAPGTYNTKELAFDMAQYVEGVPLLRRHFDFESEEVVFDEELPPSPFVIVEGLYAGSKDLESVRDLHFNIPTSIAQSVDWDLHRMAHRSNRAFPTVEARFRHQIEHAIPAFLKLETPARKPFSASSRPLAERAFMLARYAELELPTR